MRWALLLVATAFAGCADEIGDPPAGLVEGDCGSVYHGGMDRQILLDVRFAPDVLRKDPDADITSVEVAAETDGEQYAEADVDESGCVRLPMEDEGVYTFWGFGFRDDGACWYSGYIRGIYDGDPVVEGQIELGRSCPS